MWAASNRQVIDVLLDRLVKRFSQSLRHSQAKRSAACNPVPSGSPFSLNE